MCEKSHGAGRGGCGDISCGPSGPLHPGETDKNPLRGRTAGASDSLRDIHQCLFCKNNGKRGGGYGV